MPLTYDGASPSPGPTPNQVPLTYDGEVIVLPRDCEEVATMLAALLPIYPGDHASKENFQVNFMRDWRCAG